MIRFEDVWLNDRRPGPAAAAAGPDVLRGISFEIPAGGFRWLTGPSGAGKTSLLNLLALAARPRRGRVTLLGADAASLSRRDAALLRRQIGVVHQDFRLLPHLNLFDNVALPMRLGARAEPDIRKEVGDLLDWVGLSGKISARPAELAGGEQQRAAFARAIVARPKLLLADEPAGNQDDRQAERMMLLVMALHRLGATVVIATANPRLMARHQAPVLALADGALTAHG